MTTEEIKKRKSLLNTQERLLQLEEKDRRTNEAFVEIFDKLTELEKLVKDIAMKEG
ncbi:MAG: hypothetical protein ACLPX5_10270 [Dissulfurispiraceae bacterium]